MEQAAINKVEFVREVTAKYIGPRRKSVTIRGSQHAADFIRSLLKDNAREHFIALYLDASNQIVSYSIASIGSANAAPVCPRVLFQGALLAGACSLIVGHNHPSGNTQASQEDRAVTKRLKEAGHLIAIPLIDHLIVTETEHYSFAEEGMV